ncbi:MAG: DNA mismatch repair endonuclease MutL [Candidatus Marinimicrobia bacterium]|jgi:DNA mismatch repair protein MutL|nr:DNA mismatch repair endonuclease MutL [Candidatus Neomarinimicrobiota bacterium]MBT3945989.1 DNA mismatch repair endonuclease MutL [Candidatus Neomarinimicrobiota bacterium]MBT5116211.1 DNA mismatch repair endonuclease MutL [Candidatus Neomarinimicrobiota bacterium]MBT5748967.1 DNA mismatch repair endonuclease MutL [Candidatus Neomarinimicrobiota bacterium]MBT6413671.1 DNA mismatch repair endonuclease MutL [Candidatus Neomarinimicrobiota bacterium]|tara:strand:+ start:6874 stop:8658 length:1785 start_codon:yes stop_codon:yes gene_type:complete
MIKALSEDLRNKISAGEVVERPASVVKELIENSIDAGSTEVSVVVEKGGHQTIQVRDNGHGMTPDQLPSSILRYHTSKIATLDDLFSINTLGFRGEALASIASVSEMSILSSNGTGEGAELPIIDGQAGDILPAAQIGGTEITIRNLFYNTPARKKFLKTPRTELRKIVDVVRRFGLAFPEISFKLMSDDRLIFHVQAENLEDRIDNMLDPTYSRNLLPLNLVKGDYAFSGFVGNLNLVRSRPGEQYLFLNRRFIKDRLMNTAVYGAYESLVKRGEYPFFVINLILPTDQVDVNVHPMKTEVRFKDEWRVFHVLKAGVNDALRTVLDTVPGFNQSFESSSQANFGNTPFLGQSFRPPAETIPTNPNQSDMDFLNPKPIQPAQVNLERAKDYASKLAGAPTDAPDTISTENIWQIHKKYIVSEINSGLVMIDQHVAHERVLYEEAIKAFESTSMASQTMLFPEVLEFSPDDFDGLLDVLPYLEKIGFKIRKQDETSIRIEAIPSEMALGNERTVIREILDNFLKEQKQYSSFQEGLAAMFACKAAIKAGDSLTREEMQELVNRLFATEHPYYCPHGRPIIVQMSLDELDGRFERH